MTAADKKYHFPLGISTPAVRAALITGTGRSGKTTFGNILATCKNVEYQDEQWAMHIASVMASVGLIDRQLGKEMCGAAFAELINDTVLMRNANFRQRDLSTILTKKTMAEIDSRMSNIHSRDDVAKFIKENDPLFLLAFSLDPAVNLPTLIEVLPHGRVLHIVRNGYAVARHVEDKKWFSDEQVRNPSQAQVAREVRHKGAPAYVYVWVPEGQEELFLDLTPFERGLYYWCTLVEKSFITIPNSLILKYEDLLASPEGTLKRAMDFLGVEPGELTDAAVRRLGEREQSAPLTPQINATLLARAQALCAKLGYDD